MLAAQPEYYAIFMNMALCYYKLGEYERCEEQLNTYNAHCDESFTSLNLLAAVKYKQGKALEADQILNRLKNDKNIAE